MGRATQESTRKRRITLDLISKALYYCSRNGGSENMPQPTWPFTNETETEEFKTPEPEPGALFIRATSGKTKHLTKHEADALEGEKASPFL